MEARQAQQGLSTAIDGAAKAAENQVGALTAGLPPLQQTQAKTDAYINSLGNLASSASGPAKTSMLDLIAQFDDSALSAATAAGS